MGLSVSKPQKKANLWDFPVSHHATEAKVVFTWDTHNKTREAKSQRKIVANSIFDVCVYVCVHYVYTGSSWEEIKYLEV